MLIENREHAARTACSLSVSVVPVGYLAGADPVLGAFFYPDPVIGIAAIGVAGGPILGVACGNAGSAAIFGAVVALIAEAGINPVVTGVAEGDGEAPLGVLTPLGVVHHHAGATAAVSAIPAGVVIKAGIVVCNGKL